MICELNEPASPRSPVISRTATFSVFSRSWSTGRFRASAPAASATFRVIRRRLDAYGRSASMRCSARRSLAAATISIARVIFWTFLTEAIRPLTSLRVAIS